MCGPPLDDDAEDEGSVIKEGIGWRLFFASEPVWPALLAPPLRDRLRKKPERDFAGLEGEGAFEPGPELTLSALLEATLDWVSLWIEEPASDLLERFGTNRAVSRRMIHVQRAEGRCSKDLRGGLTVRGQQRPERMS